MESYLALRRLLSAFWLVSASWAEPGVTRGRDKEPACRQYNSRDGVKTDQIDATNQLKLDVLKLTLLGDFQHGCHCLVLGFSGLPVNSPHVATPIPAPGATSISLTE